MDRERSTYGVRGKRRTGGLLRIIDAVVLLLTVVMAVLLVCAYLSRWINPNQMWFFAFAGLIAPVLYIANIVMALYWVIRWKRFALVPLAVLVVGAGWISLFFRPALSKNYKEPAQGVLRVMSYNVEAFLERGERGAASTLDSVAAFINGIDPDILCLQEFQSRSEAHRQAIDSLFALPSHRHHYGRPNASGGGWGIAVYSRYPIVGHATVDLGRTTNSAMWVDLKIGSDTLRVFNVHLQTTAVDRSDREYIDEQRFLVDDGTREERVRSIFGKLRNNFRTRAAQADSLAPLIRGTRHAVVVCGDFNDTPMSYTYHTIRGDMADAFVEKGVGTPSTYKGLFNLFRIDYILHSRSIRTVSYSTPRGKYSDHKPVLAGLDI